MTTSQIKSYVAAAIATVALIDGNTLNVLSALLPPTWAKVLRVAVIFAGLIVMGRNQSWNNNHVSLPAAEAEALAGNTSAPADPLVRKAVRRIKKEVN